MSSRAALVGLLVVALSGCETWRHVSPGPLKTPTLFSGRVLAQVGETVLELEAARLDGERLLGRRLRAWRAAPGTLAGETGTGPDELAERFSWQLTSAPVADLAVPMAEVSALCVEDESGNWVLGGVGGGLLALAAGFFTFVLVSLGR